MRAGRTQADQRVEGQAGEQEPQGAAQDRHRRALHQQLPHQATAAGAQRRAQRHLTFPHGGARQLQVRHVGHRDQQDETDRAQQQEQRASHVTHHDVTERERSQSSLAILKRVGP
jgi:hypothetical protein